MVSNAAQGVGADYIEITETPGGTPVSNKTVDIYYVEWAYASLYNRSSGYIGTVKANWTATGFGGAGPSYGPTPANYSSMDAGGSGGIVLWQVSYFDNLTWHNDTVKFIVNSPAVDYIEITDVPDGTAVTDQTVPYGFNTTGHISLYNNTEGYVGTINANWSAEGIGGATPYVNTSSGISTIINVDFSSGFALWKVWYDDSITNHTDTVNFTVVPPNVDYIEITDTPGGSEILDKLVNLDHIEYGNASFYNNTIGYFGVGVVIWNVSSPDGAAPWINTSSGSAAYVDVGPSEGKVWWNASYFDGANWFNDTVILTVSPPTTDFIEITDVPGGNPINNSIVDVNFMQWGNASLFNYTFGYIGTASVNWTAEGYGDAAPSYGPTPAVSSWVDVGTENGTVLWKLWYYDGVKWHNDTVMFLINPPGVDYIEITDAPDGTPVANITVEINYNITGYASLYNTSKGYIRTVSANWTAFGLFGANPSFGPAEGNSSLFDVGGDGGAVIWNVSFFSGTQWFNDSVRFNVNPPGVDYMEITETPGGTVIGNDTVVWNYNVTGYASLFNLTEGWVGTIVANWSAEGALGSAPFIGPNASESSWLNVGPFVGIVWWNVSYFNGIEWFNDSVAFTVIFPGVDYIEITDAPGGTPISDETVIFNHNKTGFASLYNNTAGYLLTISANWSAQGDGNSIPSAGPAQNVSSWINVGVYPGTVWWNVSFFNGTQWFNDTVLFTVVAAYTDYIEITDIPNGIPLPNAGVNLGYTDSGNVSLYNITFGYLGTVVANWSAEGGGGATPSINTTVGVSTIIDVGLNDGTVWWNVSYFDGIKWLNDTVTFIINPPTVDFILITDTPGGIDLTNATVPQTFSQVGYASLYNNTKGYIGTIEANWTAFSNDTAVPTYNTTQGITCSVNVGPDSGTVIWQISYFDNQTQTWFNDSVVYNVVSPVANYIDITDGAGGPTISDITVGVGYIEWGTASLFNNTIGYYGSVSSNWSAQGGNGASPSLGSTPAVTTWVNVGFSAGMVWWNVSYFDGTGWHNDTVIFTVLPPTVDYLQITDIPDGTSLSNFAVAVGDVFWGNTSLYNTTFGYLFTIEVNWSAQGSGGATPSIGSTPAVFSWVNVGLNDGTVQWTASYFDGANWFNDTVTYTVLPPTADEIFIVDTPGAGASDIPDQTVDVGTTITGYAAAYNDTVGYFGDIIVTWSVQNSGGAQAYTSPGSGNSSLFNASSTAGSAIWIADDGQGHNDTVVFTINPPSVDFILIVDSEGTGANEILDGNVNVGYLKTGFAAAYNNSVGYIYDISVSWSVSNASGSTAFTTPSSGTNSTFNASGDAGTATWTANDGSGHTDTVVFTIISATVDEIKIVDSAGSGSLEVPDQTIGVGIVISGYAAAFNNTIGYIYDVSANWSVANTSGANASTSPQSSSMTSDLYSGYYAGTVTWTAIDFANHTDTVIFTVNPPSVDYIYIVDMEGTGSTEIPDQTVDVGTLVTGYAASFNSSIGYLGDISVSWSVSNSGGSSGFTIPSSGSNSTFNSSSTGGFATWAADDGFSHTDSVDFTINPPGVDEIFIVDSPGTGLAVIPDQTVDVGFPITGYAAAYNNSVGYIGEVSVSWSVANASGASAFTIPGTGTSSQFNSSSSGGTATWTANDGSGHTDSVIFTINPPIVDRIIIVDTQASGGAPILDQIITLDEKLTGYAASFNNSVGFIGDISVSWYVLNSGGSTASTNPSSGNSSLFNASSDPGLATWTADDGGGHTDTVILNIIPYSIDYIIIVDTIGTGSNDIPNQTVDVGFVLTGYAAAFNNSGGYVGDVAVTWNVTNSGGASAQTTPSSGSSSTFNASATAGSATWTANDGSGHTDTVIFTINPPSVDEIFIVDSAGSGTDVIQNQSMDVGTAVTGYAAAYNNSVGYIGEVSVSWSVTNSSGATAFTAPGTGTTSIFNTGSSGGTATWTADDGSGHTDAVAFTINPPTVNYIQIVDTEGTGLSELSDQPIDVGQMVTGFAAAFNDSIGYISDITVTWSVINTSGAMAETGPQSGSSSVFYSGVSGGTSTWTADDGSGHSDSVVFTINPPTIDFILIVDTAGSGVNEISDQTVEQDTSIQGYTAGFNSTIGYLNDVSVTWSVSNFGGATTSTSPPSGTASQFNSSSDPGTAIWTADDGSGHTDTVAIAISGFNVDYILIVDTPVTGSTEIPGQTVDVGFVFTGYAAAFNNTGGGYLGDIAVTWTVNNIGSSSVTTPDSGTSSEFSAGNAGGTANWTADDGSGHVDWVVFTINPPAVNFILIVDTGGTGASEIPDQSVSVVLSITGYAAAFNNTIGYIGDISVDWSVINASGAEGTTNPLTGPSSMFYSGSANGTATWTADDGSGNSDSVIFTVSPPVVDYIRIVDTPNSGTGEILNATVIAGYNSWGYAAAFNNSLGYMGDISVSWTVNNTGSSAVTSPSSGTNSLFNASGISGTATWTADDGQGHTDSVDFSILPPTIDFIAIVDTPGAGSSLIPDQTVDVGIAITGYAAAFNNSIGYMFDVAVDWDVSNMGFANASTDPIPSSITSLFYSGHFGGNVTWTVNDGAGHTDTVDFTINAPWRDFILIVDSPGTGASEISDQTVDVAFTVAGHAAAFNITIGYIGDISVLWTVNNSGGASAESNPGIGTMSIFNANSTGGSATWTAEDAFGNNDTVIFAINPPEVDEIKIVDTPYTGLAIIPNQAVGVNNWITGYIAAFNNTIGYMGDISVTWWVVNISSNASTAPLSGSNTSVLYTGHFGGTATWWADDGAGHTFSVTFTILAPTVDYILIVDTPGIGTSEIPSQNLDVGMSITGYAAAFNSSIGYLGDITVSWSVDNTGGASASTDPLSGSSSIFSSGPTGGSANWTADDGAGHTDIVTFTINPPALDYILIVDTADAGSNVITDQTVLLDVDIWGYAAGFNNTIGYIYYVSVTWSVINSGGADAATTPSGGTSSLFNSGLLVGSATWTADDGSGHTHTISFDITDYSVDYIEIVDTGGVGTITIADQTLNVGTTITGYAAAFNVSASGGGYIGDISVSWSVLNTGTTATTFPGSGVVSDFYSGDMGGTAEWTADDGAGHTYSVIFTVNPPSVDYILIVDTMGIGLGEITDKTLDVGVSITGYAASFNNSIDYIGDISVSWSVNNFGGASTSTNPLSGVSSDFYSGTSSGTADWIAEDGFGHSDSATITVNPPTEDYLMIVDSPGTGSMEIQDQTVDVGYVITGNAAIFNNTIGYLYDVSVDWSVGNAGGSISFTSPLIGSSSVFNASKDAGTATWTADDGSGHLDTVEFTINPFTVDYILIVDTPGAGTSSISDGTVGVAYTITGYAAAFNNTVGYMGDIVVSWDVVNVGGAVAFTNPGSGTSSQFNAGVTGGTTTWRADDGAGHTDTVQVTIDPPSIDYIYIVDTQDVGSSEILDQTVDVGISITGYAAAFNNTIGYLRDASVSWTVIPSSGENAYTTPPIGKSSIFNSGTIGGSVTWTADYGGGITDTVSFTINPPTLDYITIVDSIGTGINEISDQTVIRNVNVFGYAAAFNLTVGYLYDVSVVWSVSNIGGATASTFPFSGVSSQFNSGSTAGSAVWTADDGSGHTDTVIFDITIYSVDYILIVDTLDSGVAEIADQSVDAGIGLSGYAAAFNFSAPGTGYLGDISVFWTVDNVGTSAFTNPSSGTGSVFSSGDNGGIVTWTADDGFGHNDTVVFTVNAPSVDYILIVDTPGTGAQEIPGQSVDVGIEISGYAAAFNDTIGYMYDISVNWNVILGGGANATTFPVTSSSNSDFYSGHFAGTATWEADGGAGNKDTVSFTINAPVIDYIVIVDTADTGYTEISDQTVDVGFLSTGYAASFNNTIGFLGDISVDWTVDNLGGALALTTPAVGTSSTFNSSSRGGQATWTADDGQGHTDTVARTINSPSIDEIFIVDSAAIGTNVISDQTVDVGYVITGFAAAYNDSIGYMGDITGDWNVLNFGGASAYTFPNSGTSSMFNSSYKGGSATWTADDGQGHTYSVTYTINSPTIDFILLTDNPDGLPLDTVTLAIYDIVSIYASGYNTTSGYVGLVDVTWIDAPDLGSFSNDIGSSTAFIAGIFGGTTTITGQNISMAPSVSDDFSVIVLSPTLDYILVTDEPNGNLLGMVTLPIGGSVRAYASGYNNTGAIFIGLIDVDWLDISGLGTFDNNSATNTIFTAGYIGGSTTITAQDIISGKSDDFSVDILEPALDYIIITDSPDGVELINVDMNALDSIMIYASGYNSTGGTYVGLVSVNWTDDPDLGSFENDAGTSTVFSANTTGGSGTITAQNTGQGVSDTFSINIAALTVDFIIITDAPNGRELGTEALGIGGRITFYASGYNNTGPTYVGLVSVFWSDLPDFGSLSRNSGNNAVFTAGNLGGQVNITGRNTILVLSDSFFIDIAPPIIDVILITDSPDGQELTLVILGSTFNTTMYASGYNRSGGTYLGLVDVTWTADPQLGSFEITTGNVTIFIAGLAGGNVTITARSTASGVSGNLIIIIVGPTVDYILITDAVGGTEIPDQTVPLEFSVQGHASAYNLTLGYLFEASVSWNVNNGLGAFASTSIGQGATSTFDSGLSGGRASWIANDGQGHTDRVVFTIPSPTVDYIRLEDGEGNELTTLSLQAGEHLRVYAVGYNDTILRIGYVPVSWSVDGGASLSNRTGSSTTLTAREDGTFALTAEYDENNQISIPLETSAAPDGGFSMLWIIIIIIIVVVVLVVVILLKRRGEEEEGLPDEETTIEEELEGEEEPAAGIYGVEEEEFAALEEMAGEEPPSYEEVEYKEEQEEESPAYEETAYEEEPAYEEAPVYEKMPEEELPVYEEPVTKEAGELPLPPPPPPDDEEEEIPSYEEPAERDMYGVPPPPDDLEEEISSYEEPGPEPVEERAMMSLEELEAKYGLIEEVSEGEEVIDELEGLKELDEEGVAFLEELKSVEALEEDIAALEDLEGEGVQEAGGLAALEELEIEEEEGALADLSSLEEEASDAQLKCPSCGSPITMEMKQCPKCGTEFETI